MITFENRVGPADLAAQASYPQHSTPRWFLDAKLGFFIHYGLYSVPGWAFQPDGAYHGVEEAYTYHQYAEWYGNTWRITESPCRQYHEEKFGVGTSYEDFAKLFQPDPEKLKATVQLVLDVGAKYIVPTTKHHDGFCLWDTETTDFNVCARSNGVDVIKVITEATRAGGAEVGLYFSGALDWHVSDFPPIESDRDIFLYRRNDPAYSQYAYTQLTELIEKFAPKLIWNDIDWPDGGKGNADYSLTRLFSEYFAKTPEGIVNDRWGVPYHGYLTREYTHVGQTLQKPWESTRGIAKSFGVNHNESDADFLTVTGLLGYFTDVVSKGGNLLINVGPNPDGSLENRQAEVVKGLGSWMARFGQYVYGSRPWERSEARPEELSTADERYWTLPADHAHPGLVIVVRNRAANQLTIPLNFPAGTATWIWEGAPYQVTVKPGCKLSLPPADTDLPIILHLPTH